MSPVIRLQKLGFIVIALAAATALLASVADARPGGGSSIGSRGTRTFSAPPSTNTAPKPAAPIEKSMTQPGKATPAAAPASRFGGWRSLVMGGLIGAALASIFGVGALASVLGFLLQFALIAAVVYLVVSFFRSRNAPQPATARAGMAGGRPQYDRLSSQAAGSAGGVNGTSVAIGPDDFDAFERLLGEIQLAYGRNDVTALGQRVTPEMLSYFAGELDANTRKGVRNEIAEPKLLQGDLAEAWREADGEYATVAMRYSVIDTTVDGTSGRAIGGSAEAPQEVTEVWTFRRPPSGTAREWELSAIQQANVRLPLAS